MHGQIGDLSRGSQSPGDCDFYYRTVATLIEARRQGGGGAIDYDFYRSRARRLRLRALRKNFRSLLPYVRPLAAIAVLVAAIFMLPRHASDCPACEAPVAQYNSMTSNH